MDFYMGQIALFPYERVPEGWAECNGKELPIEKNQALFTLLTNRFGGDGRTWFALPNYRDQAPPGSRYFICTNGMYPALKA
jgi:microcystin-dependent protein